MTLIKRTFWALAGLLSINTFGETLISETDILSPYPMVTTASHIPQAINKAPVSITLINKELIVASGAQTWVDLFRLVPGMQAYSINGNRSGIDYHGMGEEFPSQIEVTVDGRSVYQPLFSTVEWSALNVSIDDIDYIEVVRGSNAASQGSNAFKAAINIFTEKPHLKEDTHIRLTAGSRDTQKVNINHNGYIGSLDYQLNLGFEHNDGFPAATHSLDPDDVGKLKDGRDLFTVDIRAIYTPNIKDTFDFNLGASHNHTGWGDADHPKEYVVVEWDTRFESLKWNRLTNKGNELNLHLYHTNFQANNNVQLPISTVLSDILETTISPEDVPFVLASIGAPPLTDRPIDMGFSKLEANRYDAELDYRLQPIDDLKISLGAGYRYEDLSADRLLDITNTLNFHSRRVSVNSEWSMNEYFTFNAGGILEKTSLIGTLSSYRISLNYHPTAKHGFRLSYANGERSPSLLEAKERNLDRLENTVWNLIRVSDVNLKEEKIISYELAYLANFSDRLSLDVKIFREEIRDMLYDQEALISEVIPLLPKDYVLLVNRAKINRNILNQTLNGIELQINYRPTNTSLLAFHYTYLDRDGGFYQYSHRKSAMVMKDFGDNVVPHTASILATIDLTDHVATSLWLYHTDEVDWADGNFIDEITRVDAQLRYTFPFGGNNKGGAISLIAQNLGENYSDFSRNNVFETRIYLKLELELP